MATLKSLVDETTNIKNELKTCHANLKNNLVGKGVEVSSGDKLATLVDKVKNLKNEKHYFVDTFVDYSSHAPVNLIVGADSERLYFMGGALTNTNGYYYATNSNICYNTINNTWETKANLPTARYSTSSATVGGSIYVIGGIAGSNMSSSVTTNECYNPKSNTWTTKTGASTKGYFSTVVVDNKIYCFFKGAYSQICYDTVSDTWTSKASIPTSNIHHGLCSAGNNIHAIGGNKDAGANSMVLAEHNVYDTVSNTWTTNKSNNPYARYTFSAIHYDNKIYCFGGVGYQASGDRRNTNRVDCYNVETGTWERLTNLPDAICSENFKLVGETIYCTGGTAYNTTSFKYEQFKKIYKFIL